MRILKSLKKNIREFDLFGTSTFFRFKQHDSYQSFFGGIVSILIIVVIGAIFYNRFSQCLNKTKIYSTETKVIQAIPSVLDISSYPKGKFMAAIQVSDMTPNDLNIRYFDFLIEYIPRNSSVQQKQYLEPCTVEHWAGEPGVLERVKSMDMTKMYCIPLNFDLVVGGKQSYDFKYMFMSIKKYATCSPPTNGSFPRCPTTQEMNNFFANQKRHKFQLYFINYQITPNKPDHIEPYIDERYFGYFTQKKGYYCGIYLQDFTVNTDEGIGFVQQSIIQKGAINIEPPITYQYTVALRYSQFIFAKSLTSRLYERIFQRVQDVFSFVGCLYGIICAALFIVKSYNNTAYSIALGAQLFQSNQIKQKGFFKKYKFWDYIKQKIHSILLKLKIIQKWQTTAQYDNCQKEGAKYFDIFHLIQKLLFLENSVSIVLQKHHEVGLHLREKLSLEEANKKRELANFKKKVKKIRQSQLAQKTTLQYQTKEHDQTGFQTEKNNSIEELAKILKGGVKKQKSHEHVSPIFYDLVGNVLKLDKEDASEESDLEAGEAEHKNDEKHQEIMLDLIKIGQQAKENKIISKKLQKRASLNISATSNEDLNPRNSGQDYFFPTFARNDTIESKPNEFYQNAKEKQIQALDQQQDAFNKAEEDRKNFSKVKRVITKVFKSIDIFAADTFLQYRSGLKHKTLFGGIVSIMIISVVSILFYQKMADCINKTIIYSTETKKFSGDPNFLELSTPPKGNFMISLFVTNLDLNNPKARYFDFFLENKISKFNESTGLWTDETISYQMQKCTIDHWGTIPELVQAAKGLNLDQILCLPKGISLSVQGIKRSHEFRMLEFTVRKCNDTLDPSRACDFNTVNAFMASPLHSLWFQITSAVINPQNSKYIQRFLEERTQLVFSPNIKIQASAYLDDYTVVTDESIFPWSDEVVESGSMITQIPSTSSFLNLNNPDGYLGIKIFKSVNSFSYYRKFDKVQDVLSFIRGIFGILFAGLFIINTYNVTTYEASLCCKLFKPTQNGKRVVNNFNFFNFLQNSLYIFLRSIGCSPQWESLKEYNDLHDQIHNQLDVPSVFKRLDFLQSSVETVLDDHEILGIRLKEKPSIDEAAVKREEFKQRRRFFKLIKKINNGEQNSLIIGQTLLQGNNTGNRYRDVKETEADENLIQARKSETDPTIEEGRVVLNEIMRLKPQELQEQMQLSSESDNESQQEKDIKMKDSKIVQELIRLKKEARQGDRISQKILEIVNKSVSGLLSNSFDVMDRIDQVPLPKKRGVQLAPLDMKGIEKHRNKKGDNPLGNRAQKAREKKQ